MKDPILILKEYHPPAVDSLDQVFRPVITAWLARELRNSTGRLRLEGGAENPLRDLYTIE